MELFKFGYFNINFGKSFSWNSRKYLRTYNMSKSRKECLVHTKLFNFKAM